MKTSIAIYNSHDDAVHALNILKEMHFPLGKVSIMGKADIEDDKIHIKSNKPLIATPLIAGTAIGTTLGLLVGIGVFAVPGLGFLYGAGALVGAFGGLDAGLIAGGLGSILLELGVKDEYVVKYEEHIKSGKYLIFVNGTDEEIELGKHILNHEFNELHHI